MKTFDDYIKSIKDLSDLNTEDSENAFDQILLQNIEENKIIDFLTSLSKKGESVDEIFGAVKSIKKKAKIIKGFRNSFDTCGTGGDGTKTFNISTTCAIVTAANGVCVAKHGNKAVSSLTGSADVLSELGININIDEKKIDNGQKINPHNICIKNNGNATFLNLDASNEFENMSMDVSDFECILPHVNHTLYP